LNKIDEQLSYTRGNTLLLSHFLNILNVFLRENYPSVVQDAIHAEWQLQNFEFELQREGREIYVSKTMKLVAKSLIKPVFNQTPTSFL